MSIGFWIAVGAAIAVTNRIGQVEAPSEPPGPALGAYLFRTHCAVCHGAEAKGDGPLVERLNFLPPDLTQLARRAGGRYAADTVQRIIDGRKPVKGHGGPQMPVWGDAFKNSEYGYSEKQVKEKVRALVDYLETLQEKAAVK